MSGRLLFALGAAWLACGLACGDAQQGDAAPGARDAGLERRGASAGRDERDGPAGARWDLLDDLRAEQAVTRHASDGGGTLSFAEEPAPVVAGGTGRYAFRFVVGEHGIAEGGTLEFMASPFWFWSAPWYLPDAPADAPQPGRLVLELPPGVSLHALTPPGAQRCILRVEGRALVAGESLGIGFGEGPGGVRVDHYAERTPVLHLRVDGDADGAGALVPDPPLTTILPDRPAQLVLHLPSSLAPGAHGALVVAALDEWGNVCVDSPLSLRLQGATELLGLPESLELPSTGPARRRLELRPSEAGVFRLLVTGPDELAALSNPLSCVDGAEEVLWADLHGHSRFSDGTGDPAAYYRYAREVGGLDVAALTDHDHWGFPFLDAEPERVEHLRQVVREAHAPGQFVALFGYEWTSWIHGHRHVLSFGEPETLPLFSSLDPATEDPRALWDALRGRPVRTFAHHTSGEPVLTNWEIPPDPELEPVVEVSSVHGSSEAADGLPAVAGSRSGFFVRDALDRGYRLGFVGSGDSHDGHPGLVHLNPVSRGRGGVAALLGAERTRASVREALDARRSYATTGARILLRCTLDGARMGSSLPAPGADAELVVLAHGTAPLIRLDVIRSGEIVEERSFGELELDALTVISLADLEPGEYVYVRVFQEDGQGAWSSPFYIE